MSVPEWFLVMVQASGDYSGEVAAQLLWQRGIRTPEQLAGFLNPDRYQPTSPFAFGEEMEQAVGRLQQACDRQEQVAIWGDFDADGITATAVLWEGLQAVFSAAEQLRYVIPNRLTESHGLTMAGLEALAAAGVSLVVTCDTGSTHLPELTQARSLGLDVIVTDHHTLPDERPPVVALINPRQFPADHPLADLSGVAVAYTLLEAFYSRMTYPPTLALESLLDLVAIGLIADLVKLSGDCRYLAQKGIQRLQQQAGPQATRPGVARLLELCQRAGDRPTDISYGLGPRINAISRVQGDACFGVELLTSRDRDRCRYLAEQTELANARRKGLQRWVVQDVRRRLAQIDLSTTHVIVLEDPQWAIGVLGLVAGQIAREYGRPTILLNSELSRDAEHEAMARGSARSVHELDLYDLMQGQRHLLHRFGGHPFAAGLSLPVDTIPLFAEAINRDYRQRYGMHSPVVTIAADLTVTVAQLGANLFQELKLLEPCGIGNPVPKLLIQNVWFEKVWNRNLRDWRGGEVKYIKTEFQICDATCADGFPGVWWEHYQDEIPKGRCDAIAELDFNTYLKCYQIRLIEVRSHDHQPVSLATSDVTWIVDRRTISQSTFQPDNADNILTIDRCPTTWNDLYAWIRRAYHQGCILAIAYPPPPHRSTTDIWQQLIGIAKYLHRTQHTASRTQLLQKLDLSDRTLQLGIQALQAIGFQVVAAENGFQITEQTTHDSNPMQAIALFLSGLREEQFRQQYFAQLSIETIRAAAQNWLLASVSADY